VVEKIDNHFPFVDRQARSEQFGLSFLSGNAAKS
jgi:hypothetical protein